MGRAPCAASRGGRRYGGSPAHHGRFARLGARAVGGASSLEVVECPEVAHEQLDVALRHAMVSEAAALRGVPWEAEEDRYLGTVAEGLERGRLVGRAVAQLGNLVPGLQHLVHDGRRARSAARGGQPQPKR